MKLKIVSFVSLVLLLASVAVAQQPCGATVSASPTLLVNWAQYGFDAAHTACNPYESILSPSTVGHLMLSWSDSGQGGYSAPAVANGVVYVAFGHGDDQGEEYGYLYALNASNRTQLWSFRTAAYASYSPAVANGIVYFTDARQLYALDAGTGALIWTQGTGTDNSPTVANGVVYKTGTTGLVGVVYAFDGKTGFILWQYFIAGGNLTSLTVANGVVYFGADDLNVYALNATTGELLWKYATGGWVEASPVVANGKVYFGSDDNNVYALNAATGALLWKYATGSLVQSSLAVAYGRVYASSYDKNIYALNAATGSLLWKHPLAGASTSDFAVANGVLYFASYDQNANALNAVTGALLWQQPGVTRTLGGGPAVVNGTLYFGGYQSLYAFRLPGH